MKIRFVVRSVAKRGGIVPLYVRLVDGRDFHQAVRTMILVNPAFWDAERECVKGRSKQAALERGRVEKEVHLLRGYIADTYREAKKNGSVCVRGWLAGVVSQFYSSGKRIDEDSEVFDSLFDRFLHLRDMGDGRRRHYEVLRRMIHRYESYVRHSQRLQSYLFDISTVDAAVLRKICDYITHEHIYVTRYPGILTEHPEVRTIGPRGGNYICSIFIELRAFFNWAYKTRLIPSSPFKDFEMPSERYGTPVYLSLDDVRKIYEADLSSVPRLQIQRDIFVFQCNVGCRVGDLLRLQKRDVIRGALEYIPSKTIKDRARTVVVPLNRVAMEIVGRYSDCPGERLLPFESSERFNDDIKSILKIAGVTYLVTELDTVTRKEKKVPINEIASSHMARRTFIGNIYRRVKDPDLVSSLTGHVEGSRAFARYRTIDIDIKKDLVRLLEIGGVV